MITSQLHITRAIGNARSRARAMSNAELAEGLAGEWKHCPPPYRGLSELVLKGRAFFSIRDGYRSDFLKSVLDGANLCDLGAADYGAMLEFSRAYNVASYTAVDRHYPYPSASPGPGINTVRDDMLNFLARQAPGSASIVMNAIDQLILTCSDVHVEMEYRNRLVKEIARVVPYNGVAFGINCPVLEGLPAYGFESINLVERRGVSEGSFLMQKTQN
jgi:hypothetical protein